MRRSSKPFEVLLHPREQEIREIMEFLEFSINPKTSFKGTICFNFQDDTDPSLMPFTYTVHVDSSRTVTQGRYCPDKNEKVCSVTLSIQDFLYLYSGKASASDIAKMCYGGKVRVHDFAYRTLSSFAASFDFSTSRWHAFYEQRDKLLKINNVKTMESISNNGRAEKQVKFHTLNRALRGAISNNNCSSTTSVSFLNSSPYVTKDHLWKKHSFIDFKNLNAKAINNPLGDSLNFGLPFFAGMDALIYNQKIEKLRKEKRHFRRVKSTQSFNTFIHEHGLLQKGSSSESIEGGRGSPGITKFVNSIRNMPLKNDRRSSGYISTFELVLREVKIQGSAALSSLSHHTGGEPAHSLHTSPSVPWVWTHHESNMQKIAPAFNARSLRMRQLIKDNFKRDLNAGKAMMKRSLITLKASSYGHESGPPMDDYYDLIF